MDCISVRVLAGLTVPLGYNSTLDECLRDGSLTFTHKGFMKRISGKPEWIEIAEECALAEVRNRTYRRCEVVMIAVQQN